MNMSMSGEECRSQAGAEIVGGPSEAARNWVIEMNEEVQNVAQRDPEELKRWKTASIYRIKGGLNREAYQPQLVSIGPYHYGEEQLKEMEEHKKRALAAFLKRDGQEKSLQFYVEALDPIVEDLKNAYYDLDRELKKESGTGKFLRMMILDGCFVLELIRTSPKPKRNDYYAADDPVFSEHSHHFFDGVLQRDMLMLENQLPLLLLLKLVEAQALWNQKELTRQILKFFGRWDDDERGNVKESKHYFHILDLYRASLILPKPVSEGKQRNCLSDCLPITNTGSAHKARVIKGPSTERMLASCCNGRSTNKHKMRRKMRQATELKEAGIRLGKSRTAYLDDITFQCGVLRLPPIIVDDAKKSLYLNLMAFERLHVGTGDEVTWYAYFMDRLIEDASDVRLLHRRHVLDNLLGSDHEVASLFNVLSTDVSLDCESRLGLVEKKVMKYYRRRDRRCLAYAKHNYFTNAWVTLTIVAAVLIFALTVTQTVYAVLDYHNKK